MPSAASRPRAGLVHFGYRDGIAQPRSLAWAPSCATCSPRSPTGDLLLGGGHVNVYGGNYARGHAGRARRQRELRRVSHPQPGRRRFRGAARGMGPDAGLDPEVVAAKLMGRWRNGVPLALVARHSRRPTRRSPSAGSTSSTTDRRSRITRTSTTTPRAALPVGAHMRRLNPRAARAMGMPHSRRITRSMPYGPELKPGAAEGRRGPGPRGLLPLRRPARCSASSSSASGQPGPVHGAACAARASRSSARSPGRRKVHHPHGRRPRPDRPERHAEPGADARGLYCLLPGIGGLRYLASHG